jgi:lipoprotein-anchoring transpeptidase ErfK/SrfK
MLPARAGRLATVAVMMLALTAGILAGGTDAGRRTTAPGTSHDVALVAVTTTSTLSTSKATIANVYHRISVYKSANGAFLRHLSNRTPLGSLRTLLVTARRSDGWLQVLLPVRPNGTRGWIRASSVIVITTPFRIVINRKYRTLKLLRSGSVVGRYPVAVGAPSTPTPTGLFFIADKIDTGNPGGAFGPYALGLSGYSNVLFSFDGGDGVVGIHGTNVDSSVGRAVSHGCVRMHNRDIKTVYRKIWLGTPVLVR